MLTLPPACALQLKYCTAQQPKAACGRWANVIIPAVTDHLCKSYTGSTQNIAQNSSRGARKLGEKRPSRSCTLTSLSQPADTMMGLFVTGLKRTQDTHSVWLSGSPIVYLHSPRVFHSLIDLSREPDTICSMVRQALAP